MRTIIGDPLTNKAIIIDYPAGGEWISDQYILPVLDFAHGVIAENAGTMSDFSGWFDWVTNTLDHVFGWIKDAGGKVTQTSIQWEQFLASLEPFYVIHGKTTSGKYVYCQLKCNGKSTGKAYRIELVSGALQILPREWTGENPRIDCDRLPAIARSLLPTCESLGMTSTSKNGNGTGGILAGLGSSNWTIWLLIGLSVLSLLTVISSSKQGGKK